MTSERQPFFQWLAGLIRRDDLTPATKLVAIALRDRLGQNGECWPGESRVSKDTALSLGAVKAAVKRLEERGVLEVTRTAGKVNAYRFKQCTSTENEPVQKTDGTGSENGREPGQKMAPNLQSNQPKNQAKKTGGGKEAGLPAIPEKLRGVESFEAKWAEWLDYRRQDKRKPVTPRMAAGQFRLLLEQPDPVAVLEASIRNGWLGLFAGKESGQVPRKSESSPAGPSGIPSRDPTAEDLAVAFGRASS